MKLLRRVFGMDSTVTTAVDEIPAVTSRGALHAAIAVKQRHERELAAAQAAVTRANDVIADAAAAEAAAADAERLAAEASKAWALGAGDDDESAHDAAMHCRALAQRLGLKARGATAAMPELTFAEDAARLALDAAISGVQEAVHAIMLSEIETDFTLLESYRAESEAAEGRIFALAHTLRHGRLYDIQSGGSHELLQRLDALQPRVPSEDKLRELARPWVEFARALVVDPNSELT